MKRGQHRRKPIGMPTAAQKAGALAAEKKVADAILFEPRGATVRMIPLCHIEVAPKRMRALRPATVDEIAESIQARGGLLQPIVVRPRRQRKDSGECYSLVAGWHRFEAVRKLGHDRIAAAILDGLNADAALLAEIDENLIRADLSPAERTAHVGRRKELYEKLHPETKHGGDRKSQKAKSSRQNGDLKRFTKDVAKKTGQSERKIQRDVTRASKVGVLPDIVGTTLDKGDEIDALAKLPVDEQRKLAEQAKSGERISAKTPPPPPPPPTPGPASVSEAEHARNEESENTEHRPEAWPPPAPNKTLLALSALIAGGSDFMERFILRLLITGAKAVAEDDADF